MAKINHCPSCKAFRSLTISKNRLSCSECSFKLNILCPYCNVGQLDEVADNELCCQQCKKTMSPSLLEYIIQNKLKVDTSQTCQYCNNPLLLREEANVSPRCFDHPNCGNQGQLFDAPTDTVTNVFIDFETTGLEIGNESIIELGACKVEPNGKEYFFQEFVKPVNEVSPLITKITGITNEMVKDAPTLNQVLIDFIEFCGPKVNIIAHNAQFDIPWLLTSLTRHKANLDIDNVLCTLKWAKVVEEGKRSLGALSKKYQIGHENAHRALSDAVVTKCLYYIYEKEHDDRPFEALDRYAGMADKIIAQFPNFIQP